MLSLQLCGCRDADYEGGFTLGQQRSRAHPRPLKSVLQGRLYCRPSMTM